MNAPTRAIIVEDVEAWMFSFQRAARLAGISETYACSNLGQVREALRQARFDIAILDLGLDPDDDLNSEGAEALEMIRSQDGPATQVVLVTGWQGGDRMSMQSSLTNRFGVDWAYMKDRYEANDLIEKLSELLTQTRSRQAGAPVAPMGDLEGEADSMRFQSDLLGRLKPTGGVETLFTLVGHLLSPVVPLIASTPQQPMVYGPDATCLGVYWSRALAAAVAVELSSRPDSAKDEDALDTVRQRLGIDRVVLQSRASQKNLVGRLWELPGLERIEFPG
jgi:DNA-binding response OmpR family regulator